MLSLFLHVITDFMTEQQYSEICFYPLISFPSYPYKTRAVQVITVTLTQTVPLIMFSVFDKMNLSSSDLRIHPTSLWASHSRYKSFSSLLVHEFSN